MNKIEIWGTGKLRIKHEQLLNLIVLTRDDAKELAETILEYIQDEDKRS